MRAGKLKTRRYKTHPLRGIALLLTGILLGAGAFACFRGDMALPLIPFERAAAAKNAPEEAPRAETTLTLPAQSWYALQLGAFDEISGAEALAALFQSRGAAGCILKKDQYLVLAAAYETRSGAQSVQMKLKNQHQVDTVIVEITRPEITFRLSGRKDSLDALRDALDALHEASGHLSGLSLLLDRGEGTRQQALDALRSEKNTVDMLKARLQSLFSQSAHPTVSEITRILDDFSRALDRALNASGQSALGAQIKYCQLLCLCSLFSFAQALA
ncbi:MAG: SPOR domain-containing protein [Clostridia bacterium]|nr:SPOR domain-containing protein [Clostridia bacterium]